MAIHYNAFISYRHHPEDIRVATQIQKSLERFRVPKALRGKVKLPLRLFRDKDELPITSNLTGDIFEALENSDFLIVICSVHTKESMWVQREIETFLKTHSRDKVLTVLVNGEPYDVIPEVLLYEDVEDPVTGEMSRMPMEPLSCDWRIGHRKAMKEELPRLAAALLHCGYDELRQRQKQYRMRQLIAVFSVALAASLALTGYFLYTTITIRNANIQIRENLDRALRNQSQHLATAAREKLESGDRLTAIALLLEALPSEEDPRPYVPGAEYVLTEALGLYSGQYEMAAQAALIPTGSAVVVDFLVTGDRETIYLQDSRSMITAWDHESLSCIGSIEPGSVINTLVGTTAEGNLLVSVVADSSLRCYSREGALLWQQKDVFDAKLSGDSTSVYVIRRENAQQRVLEVRHGDTGEEKEKPLVLTPGPDGSNPYSFAVDRITEHMAIPVKYSDSRLCLVDPEDATVTPLMVLRSYIKASCITEEGNYLFMVGDGSGEMNGTYGNMNTSSPMGSDIFCYDAGGTLLWQSKITTCTFTGTHTLACVPETQWIFCQSGDTLQLIRREDGAVVQTCDATASVVSIVHTDKDFAMGFLSDGTVFDYNFLNNECIAMDYNMEENLRKGASGSGFFTLAWDSTQVTKYNFQEVKNNWDIALDTGSLVTEFRPGGNVLALRVADEICLLDPSLKSFRWAIPRENRELYGYSADGRYLWAGDSNQFARMDVQTGQTETYPVPYQWEDKYLGYVEAPIQVEDRIWYPVTASGKLVVCCYEPVSGDMKMQEVFGVETADIPPEVAQFTDSVYLLEYYLGQSGDTLDSGLQQTLKELLGELKLFEANASKACLVAVDGNVAWVMSTNGELYRVDMAAGTSDMVLKGLAERPAMAFRPSDGAAALAVGNEILLYQPGEDEPMRVSLDLERGGSLCFREEELLVVCDTGYLLRFDGNLRLVNRVGLTVTYSFGTELFSKYADKYGIVWTFGDDNKLYLNLYNAMNVIDCDCWETIAFVPKCLMYEESSQQFLCLTDDTLRAFSRYSTGQLLEEARQQLGSFSLSETLRQAYGLES